MRFAQLVMGPAGSGKSSYCTLAQEAYALTRKRNVRVVNLDPAAEHFDYRVDVDIRDLIEIGDVMEDKELKLGPNGGLVFCLEYLLDNLDWLEEALGYEDGGEYFIFDCPGQIELYTHLPVMRKLVDALRDWNFRVCTAFLVDSHFVVDGANFISASLAALSAMTSLEAPHVNVLSKVDLLGAAARRQLDSYLIPDIRTLLPSGSSFVDKYARLTEALGSVLDNYSLVKFIPLDPKDEENVQDLLQVIDNILQYGEEEDVRSNSMEDLTQGDDDAEGHVGD